jgi:two-component system response regulator AtoC
MTIAQNLRTFGPRPDAAPPPEPFDVPLPQDTRDKLTSLSRSPLTPALIVALGESRRLAARTLHALSAAGASGAPFVEVDCCLYAEDTTGSELFGQDQPALGGRERGAPGLVASAQGGTLFLDHLTALPPALQARLLRLLDGITAQRAARAGAGAPEIRVVAGSDHDPLEAVRAGRLRDDIYRELAVFRIDIPPLRERGADILELARAQVRHFAERLQKPVTGLSADAENALLAYDFPGHERELRAVIERAMILTQGTELSAADLGLSDPRHRQPSPEDHFFWVDANPGGTPPPLDVVDRAYVARVLTHTSGRRLAAAHLLGISYPTFLKRLRELGFDRPQARAGERSRI